MTCGNLKHPLLPEYRITTQSIRKAQHCNTWSTPQKQASCESANIKARSMRSPSSGWTWLWGNEPGDMQLQFRNSDNKKHVNHVHVYPNKSIKHDVEHGHISLMLHPAGDLNNDCPPTRTPVPHLVVLCGPFWPRKRARREALWYYTKAVVRSSCPSLEIFRKYFNLHNSYPTVYQITSIYIQISSNCIHRDSETIH